MLHGPSKDRSKSYCHNQTQDIEMSDVCFHETELADNFHVNKFKCITSMQTKFLKCLYRQHIHVQNETYFYQNVYVAHSKTHLKQRGYLLFLSSNPPHFTKPASAFSSTTYVLSPQ